MDELERRANWRVDRARPLVERVYRYAEGMMGLKEFEYFGAARSGTLPERLAALRESLLAQAEAKRLSESRRLAAAGLARISHHPDSEPFRRVFRPLRHSDERLARL